MYLRKYLLLPESAHMYKNFFLCIKMYQSVSESTNYYQKYKQSTHFYQKYTENAHFPKKVSICTRKYSFVQQIVFHLFRYMIEI